MKWETAAEAAIQKIPFSERRKVRARAEAAALKAGKETVNLQDAMAAAPAYRDDLAPEPADSDWKAAGFRLEVCTRAGKCPNRAHRYRECDETLQLAGKIRGLLEKEDLAGFLRSRVKGPIRPHHAFSVSVSDCPNACSRPQIKDIGIIGAASPVITDNSCVMCGACEDACRERAVVVDAERGLPVIDPDRCISCGSCISVCPTGAIDAAVSGYRIMIGGKLGRHPRLATELPGIHDAETVLSVIGRCVADYKARSTGGKRFAQIVADDEENVMSRYIATPDPEPPTKHLNQNRNGS